MQLPCAIEPQLHAQIGTEVPINHFYCTLCQVSLSKVVNNYVSFESKYHVLPCTASIFFLTFWGEGFSSKFLCKNSLMKVYWPHEFL